MNAEKPPVPVHDQAVAIAAVAADKERSSTRDRRPAAGEGFPAALPRPGPALPIPDRPASILLVDDQPQNLLALEAVLGNLGPKLVCARSGLEALRSVLREDFALIIMDAQMPVMDGFETAAMIRQRPRSRHTPIMFLTAFPSAEVQVFKGYSVGAVDYLTKPIVPAVLRSKVAVFVDIFQKTREVERQAELLRQAELREHQRQLSEARQRWEAERLHDEIRLARQIQQRFFPAAPLPLAGFDISGASFPAEATGGDYFDYIPMCDGALAVVIGDVAGHGLGPALLMAELRAYLRAFLSVHTDLGQILTLVNRALASDTPEDRFATLLLARIDASTRSFAYSSAGHTAGYLLNGSGAVKELLRSTGVPLAVLPENTFAAAAPLTLQPGEMVLLLTDGIMEAHGSDQALFGAQRALDVIQAQRSRPAREIVQALYRTVRDFCGTSAQLDDMTAILIKTEPSLALP